MGVVAPKPVDGRTVRDQGTKTHKTNGGSGSTETRRRTDSQNEEVDGTETVRKTREVGGETEESLSQPSTGKEGRDVHTGGDIGSVVSTVGRTRDDGRTSE